MLATETVNALERNLITENEAIEQAMVDNVGDLYRKAMLELAPQLAETVRAMEHRPC